MAVMKRDVGHEKSKLLVCAFNFLPYNDTSSNVAAKTSYGLPPYGDCDCRQQLSLSCSTTTVYNP